MRLVAGTKNCYEHEEIVADEGKPPLVKTPVPERQAGKLAEDLLLVRIDMHIRRMGGKL
jgi:hypothetical protein